MRYRPWRPMPAPTRRGPASPMRRFLAKPRIPLRSRCALRSMPSYGSASLRAPLTAAPAGSTAPHGSPLSGRPLSRRRGTRARAKPLAASLRSRIPLALTIPRARGADDLASRTWNARFTFVRTKPLRDVARTNHLAPAGVLADYRATRRVGSAALFSPLRSGERKGLAGLIPRRLVARHRSHRRSWSRVRGGSSRAKFLFSMNLATRVASHRVSRRVHEDVDAWCRVFAPAFLPSEMPRLRLHAFPLWMRQQISYCKYHDTI